MRGWTAEHIKRLQVKNENSPAFSIAEALSTSQVYEKTSATPIIAQRIPVKPMSVNHAWKGKRYKTDAYKQYENLIKAYLEDNHVPHGSYELHLLWGLSTNMADFDNPVKPFIDILQKKYSFNDKLIQRCVIEKVIVEKGKEFIEFQLNLL